MIHEQPYGEEFCGVDVSFSISYVKIDEQDRDRAIKDFYIEKNNSFFHNINDTSETTNLPLIDRDRLRQVDPFLVAMSYSLMQALNRIENKLDNIIHGGKTGYVKDSKRYTAECIRLSGDGIIFRSSQKLNRGELIKAHIVLPEYPPSIITAIVKVIKVISGEPAESQGYIYTSILKFCAIAEEDRDEIFRYVTDKQREIIRNERK